MKRAGNLFPAITDWHNLRRAYCKALRGKRRHSDVRLFAARLEHNLAVMAQQLEAGSFPLGNYEQFTVFDPKERLITAPCFQERVLHHAIMNVCEPVFERLLIDQTYACRVGRGRLVALEQARKFARRFGFFLKLDVRKYFDSVHQPTLFGKLTRIFKDQRLLLLLYRIITSYQTSPECGLPIGSLTSQHFANFYLACFDRFVKQDLRARGYVRYMDDCLIWAESSPELVKNQQQIRQFLMDNLRLELKPEPYINRSRHGIDFLGCRVFPTHLELNRRSKRRFARRLCHLEQDYLEDRIGELELQQRSQAVVAFATAGGVKSWRFRQAVVQRLVVGGQGLEPGEPGWQLEQQRQELPVGEPQ